jgi:hypothetical protein
LRCQQVDPWCILVGTIRQDVDNAGPGAFGPLKCEPFCKDC